MPQSAQISAYNATQAFPEKINFYRLMDYIECLSFQCKLDSGEISKVLNSAFLMEQSRSNSSDILIVYNKDFLLDIHKKITKTSFDKEHITTLAQYVADKILEMVEKSKSISPNRPACSKPPDEPKAIQIQTIREVRSEVSNQVSSQTALNKQQLNQEEQPQRIPVLENVFNRQSQQRKRRYPQPPNPHLPVVHLPNTALNFMQKPQIVSVNCYPLPSQFQTIFYDHSTRLNYWYDGNVIGREQCSYQMNYSYKNQ